MTHQPTPGFIADPIGVSRRIAQLAQVEALVAKVAGAEPDPAGAALERGARIAEAYAHALPIEQKLFDKLAERTARWAAVGVEALIAGGEERPPNPAAAAVLARELVKARKRMEALVTSRRS